MRLMLKQIMGRYIWDQVANAGEKWNITPYGTESMHVLRAEKGYIICWSRH